MERDLDLLPVGLEDVAAQALGRGVADGVEQPVESVPPAAELRGGRRQLAGLGHVDLEHLALDGELACGPPGQRQPAARAAEHHLGALLLGGPRHGEGQGGVRQHAGDQDALSLEESHAPKGYCRTRPARSTPPVGRVRRGPSGRVAPEVGVHKVWPMRIGILGGTGPAGRGLAVRLAAAGDEVVLGSRDAERAAGVAARTSSRPGPTTPWPSRARSNEDCAAADLVVMATPWDGAVATVRPLAGALAGKVVVSMANALVKEGREFLALMPPRGSVAATLQAVLPKSLVSASFHHLPASEMEKLSAPMAADVLVCSDHPEASEATRGPGRPRSTGCAASTPAACPRRRPSRRSPPC